MLVDLCRFCASFTYTTELTTKVEEEDATNIAKIHMLTHAVDAIRNFGSLHSVNTEAGEHHHAIAIKRCYVKRKSVAESERLLHIRERRRFVFATTAAAPMRATALQFPKLVGVVGVDTMPFGSMERLKEAVDAANMDVDFDILKHWLLETIESSQSKIQQETGNERGATERESNSEGATSESGEVEVVIDISSFSQLVQKSDLHRPFSIDDYVDVNCSFKITLFNTAMLAESQAVHCSRQLYGRQWNDTVSVYGELSQIWYAKLTLIARIEIRDALQMTTATHEVAVVQWLHTCEVPSRRYNVLLRTEEMCLGAFDVVPIASLRRKEDIASLGESLYALWWYPGLENSEAIDDELLRMLPEDPQPVTFMAIMDVDEEEEEDSDEEDDN